MILVLLLIKNPLLFDISTYLEKKNLNKLNNHKGKFLKFSDYYFSFYMKLLIYSYNSISSFGVIYLNNVLIIDILAIIYPMTNTPYYSIEENKIKIILILMMIITLFHIVCIFYINSIILLEKKFLEFIAYIQKILIDYLLDS